MKASRSTYVNFKTFCVIFSWATINDTNEVYGLGCAIHQTAGQEKVILTNNNEGNTRREREGNEETKIEEGKT